MSVLVIVAISALSGALLGGGSTFLLTRNTGGEVVEAVNAPALAHEETVQEVTSSDRARWVCEGDHYDQVACMAVLLCAQVAGGTVQPSACDAAVNRWVSASGWTSCAGDKDCLAFEGRRK